MDLIHTGRVTGKCAFEAPSDVGRVTFSEFSKFCELSEFDLANFLRILHGKVAHSSTPAIRSKHFGLMLTRSLLQLRNTEFFTAVVHFLRLAIALIKQFFPLLEELSLMVIAALPHDISRSI